ncbi:DUF4325 domain-containing protein [Beggiatoa alba]|nr:DUF4325 domain-containing protein [Beggiatoa alba]
MRKRGEIVRRQILRDVRHHPNDIAAHIGQIFSITRQAVNKHLKKLIDEGWLSAEGSTRKRVYILGSRRENTAAFKIEPGVNEHKIYFENFSWVLEGIPKNVDDIIFHGFTEMVNNAIDHSEGTLFTVRVKREPNSIRIFIVDNGEGIFRRITRLCHLVDERQAIIELSKGKLTTDISKHSGQGIFFTSKMFDTFFIDSIGLHFSHNQSNEFDWLLEVDAYENDKGTAVYMGIALDSTRVVKEVFDQYTTGEDDDFSFNKTVVPVKLAIFGREQLVSRSQAKRLLARIENFKIVLFDFDSVHQIGQAFADEIFRVYKLRHPEITLLDTNSSEDVKAMIKRAQSDL